jgi:hypothetical protein
MGWRAEFFGYNPIGRAIAAPFNLAAPFGTWVYDGAQVNPLSGLELSPRQQKDAQFLLMATSPMGMVRGTTVAGAGIVYRGLAVGEDATLGLLARAPGAGNSVVSHVGGQRASQWISTTKSLDIARAQWGQNGVVAIDLSKVTTPVMDLSGGIPGMSPNYMLSRWAAKMQEVLILDEVPASAITIVK